MGIAMRDVLRLGTDCTRAGQCRVSARVSLRGVSAVLRGHGVTPTRTALEKQAQTGTARRPNDTVRRAEGRP